MQSSQCYAACLKIGFYGIKVVRLLGVSNYCVIQSNVNYFISWILTKLSGLNVRPQNVQALSWELPLPELENAMSIKNK